MFSLKGNKIIIFGGYDGKGRSNQLYLLNLEDMNWSHVLDNEKFPGSRQRHSALAVDNRKILIFGGFDGTKWLNDIHVLDVANLMENIIQKESMEEFQDNMKKLINNKDFSDISFKLDNDKIFYGHKFIFAGRSSFFKEKFTEMTENILNINNMNLEHETYSDNYFNFKYIKNENEINVVAGASKVLNNENHINNNILELSEISFETFYKIAEYIYTGKLEKMNDFNICDVLIWSKFFRLKELKDFCENYLIYGMNSNNVIDILITSYKYSFGDLKNYAVNYIMNNFQEISGNSTFYELEAFPQLMMEIMILSMNKIERD